MNRQRWELTETLLEELCHSPISSGLSLHPSLRELFVFYACSDPRFTGLSKHEKGYLIFEGATGEAAICKFLDLPVSPGYGKMTAATVATICQEFDDTTQMREWIRRKINKIKE